MKTIKEFLIDNEFNATKAKLERFIEIEAPQVIIDGLTKITENKEIFTSNWKCGGDKSLLETEYKSHEILKGNGGKIYICFNNSINYFPEARYGKFISKSNRGN